MKLNNLKRFHIALCGAGGTGKGTLLKAFSELYKPSNYVQLSSPLKPIGTLFIPESSSYADMETENKKIFQYSALAAQMNAERTARDNNLSFLSERSVIDFIPYYYDALVQDDYYLRYSKIIYKYLAENPYDILVYLPIEFDPHDEKAGQWKERDTEKRMNTDEGLRNELEKIRIKLPDIHILEVRGTPETRAKIIYETLKEIDRQLYNRVVD